MIVVCERCSTRFKLDEARIPGRGAQVRCSRCKHAFFVVPSGATADTVVQDVVAEATDPGASSAPTVTTDLDRTAFDTRAGAASEGEDDEWEFNEDPPAGSRSRAAPPPSPQAKEPSPRPEASSSASPSEPPSEAVPDSLLDELGDPKDWDFGAEGASDAAEPPSADPEPASVAAPVEEQEATPAAAPQPPKRKRARKSAAKAGRWRRRASWGASWGVSSLLLEGVGYLAVALLFSAGFGRVVERGVHPISPEPAISGAAVPVTGSGADAVRLDFVENASAGTLVVISGRRNPPQLGTALRVEWTAQGRPIPGTATLAGPTIPPAWLREADPRELRSLLAQAAAHPDALMEGHPQGSGFVAVYEAVPHGATGLRVSTVALPGAAPKPTPTSSPGPAPGADPERGATGQRGAAPAGAAPSPSSRPSPRPSSG